MSAIKYETHVDNKELNYISVNFVIFR